MLIEDPLLAAGFRAYWDRLDAAGSGYPASLTKANAQPALGTTKGRLQIRAWTTPVPAQVDLDDARALIKGAQQGALFLMFRPGNTDTLIDDIKKLHGRGKFIRGVVNVNFEGPNSGATIEFFNRSATAEHGRPELILPDHLKEAVGPLSPEIGISGVLIHSKTVVLDPFGDHPVVMTGSHNLGTKASAKNDDNLVIVENAPGIAAEFAVYIMNIYDQYRWRYEKGLRAQQAASGGGSGRSRGPAGKGSTPPKKPWDGLAKTDAWQNQTYLAAAAKEGAFWFANRG